MKMLLAMLLVLTLWACVCLYAALAWELPQYLRILLPGGVAALWAAIPGHLKLYCNVNVVISGLIIYLCAFAGFPRYMEEA